VYASRPRATFGLHRLLLAGWFTLAAGAAGSSPAAAADSPSPGAAASGRQTFIRVGCSECHGTLGQGSSAGRNLSRQILPLPALIAFVRAATGAMPSYSEAVLSDAEITDIHAYLQSLRPSAPVERIPALKDLRDTESGSAPGG
jgi:mono/diheme cytochrome c family protein